MYLPPKFTAKMKPLLGDEFDDFIRSFDEKRHTGLRVNTAKISVERFREICPFKIEPIPWIKNGFYYDADEVRPAKHPYYYAGLYYLQEPSAMTPAACLNPQPYDKVLDICAAPGGKATAVGSVLGEEGLLVANDISSSRAKGLLKNIETAGIKNAVVTCADPSSLVSVFPEYFDKILVDAPCSGEGMFRKDPKMIKAWEKKGPEYYVPVQRSILISAAKMLKPGGTLLYSTCTFDPDEDEGAVTCLMEQMPEFSVIPVKPYEGFARGFEMKGEGDGRSLCDCKCDFQNLRSLKNAVRIWPHRMRGEGHFIALLKKADTVRSLVPGADRNEDYGAAKCAAGRDTAREKAAGRDTARKNAALRDLTPKGTFSFEALDDFFSRVSRKDFCDPARLTVRGEQVFLSPKDLPSLGGVRVLREGLLLGSLKKDRFEPSQALAMCLREGDYEDEICLAADDERVIRYLKGETTDISDIESDDKKGWRLVTVDGFALGWGKSLSGVLKNKYHPGWRWSDNG